MKILNESADELILYCPATGKKLFGGLALFVGCIFLILGIGLILASVGIPIMPAPVGGAGTKTFDILFVMSIGLAFAVPGKRLLSRAHNLTFIFDGKENRLLVLSKVIERMILFANIMKAEVHVDSGEGDDVYGLCLVLNDTPDRLHFTDFLTQERSTKADLANRINNFLQSHRTTKR